jgi:hypothetical protein
MIDPDPRTFKEAIKNYNSATYDNVNVWLFGYPTLFVYCRLMSLKE